jgi:hypothetical protein
VRTAVAPVLDGKLDDPEWEKAVPFTDFIQVFPQELGEPSERTEVRVLFDDVNLYVAFHCFDSQPEHIDFSLATRDQTLPTDHVALYLDPRRDRRNAHAFIVSAAGTLADALVTQDNEINTGWNGNWEAVTHRAPDGWTAELRIPVRILRFDGSDFRAWGFAFERRHLRTNELLWSMPVAQAESAFVSRFGQMTGLDDLRPGAAYELTPYVATRLLYTPASKDPRVPQPRIGSPSADLGVDLKANLDSQTFLNVTVNPDFGQVEADEVILNLDTVELFREEKRPFFTEGLELFKSPVQLQGTIPQTVFYSRRIGSDSPIFAAAKWTTALRDGVQLSVLEGVTASAWAPLPDDGGVDRTSHWSLARPFHLGPRNELPDLAVSPSNYLASVLRGELGGQTSLGLSYVHRVPLSSSPSCAGSLTESPDCKFASHVAAADFSVRSAGGEWEALGQTAVSWMAGGPQSVVQQDGTLLARNDVGPGGYVTLGKLRGDPWKVQVDVEYAHPDFNLNAAGFNELQNNVRAEAHFRYRRQEGFGFLADTQAWLHLSNAWSADGKGTPRFRSMSTGVQANLLGFNTVLFEVGINDPQFDLREVPEVGVAMEITPAGYLRMLLESDPRRRVVVSAEGQLLRIFPRGPSPTSLGTRAQASVLVRPTSWFQSTFSASGVIRPYSPRFVDSLPSGEHLFGRVELTTLSLTFKQNLALTPRLSFQAYAQLFGATGVFHDFFRSEPGLERIRIADLVPESLPPLGFRTSALNVSVVLRWEYRLGSTFYLVYTRGQQESPVSPFDVTTVDVLPRRLAQGPTTDGVLLKWSYLFGD